ncbi:MAG: hypothetical protein FWE57_00460 [Chitinispirillia bacterium]|nr:hypothetical protein [Chitinispirillia bacterium]
MHGILEWLLIAVIGALGFALNKWVPFKKIRYYAYAVFFLIAFIFNINNVLFASDSLNGFLYIVFLTIITELLWLCGTKKNKLLTGTALLVFIPVFISTYASALVIIPFPCHENKNVIAGGYTCASGSYTLKKRQSLDVFEPGHVYTLYRSIKRYPIEKRVDKYTTPKGYHDAYINPKYECLSNGIQIDLYVDDSYVLWSVKEIIEDR